MYKPDRVFMRSLKAEDGRLGVKFNGRHFVITYDRGHGEPVNIHVVKGEDGGFRQPDRRDLEFVQSGDQERESPKEKLQRVSSYIEKEREKMKKKSKEMFRGIALDNKIQLRKAFGKITDGKDNYQFRRITPKPRGIVYE